MAVSFDTGIFSVVGLDSELLIGAKLYWYATGTSTPLATYSDDDLTVPNSNPVVAGGDGRFGPIYLQNAEYKYVLKTALGVTLVTRDPISGRDPLTVLDGDDGSDLVGHQANILGSVDTTVGAKLREFKSVKADFGAVGDGSANDTGAFNLAIAYANNAGGNVTLWVPDGEYNLTGALTPITVDHVNWVGSSSGGAILSLSYNGASFTYTGYAGGFENVQIAYPSAPPANAVFMLQDGGTGQNIKNCRVSNIRTFVQAGTSSTSGGALTVSGLNGNAYNGGSPFFNLYAGAGLFIINAGVYVAGVPNPTNDRTSTMTTVSGTSFIKTNGKTWDTISIGSACIFERWWRVLDFVTSGAGDLVLNTFVDPSAVCDFIRDDVYHLEATAGSGGIVTAIIQGYANSWEGRSINISAAGVVRAVDIVGIISAFNGYECVKLNGAAASRIRIDRVHSVSANRLNTGVPDINILNGTHIQVLGGELGENGASGGTNWAGTYGLAVAADLNFITIADNDCDGATGFYSFGTNTSPSGNRRIRDNINADYAGLKSSAPYTLPASTVPWTNLSGFEVEVSVGGGTVTGIQRNAVLTGMTSGTITIMPGDNFTLTYSVAPTIQFYVKP